MGRRTDDNINIKTCLDKKEDRYIIGYIMQGEGKKIPIVMGLNIRTGIAYIKNAREAIADQREIYRVKNIDKGVSGVNRVLLEKPHVFYGFSKPPVELNRKEEAELRKKVRKLSETMTEREIDRQFYGDEIFFIIGKFQTKAGIVWMALGKIKKENGEEQAIRQILAKEEDGIVLELKILGIDGACYNINDKNNGNYFTWGVGKQSLGVPKVEIIRKGKEGIEKTYAHFDPMVSTKFTIYNPEAKKETKLFDYDPSKDDEDIEESKKDE